MANVETKRNEYNNIYILMKRVFNMRMIRTHLVLSMRRAARHDCELVSILSDRDLGARWLTTRSHQDIRTGDEEIRIVNQKRKEMRRRSPASCPRFVSSGLEPRRPRGRWRKTRNAQWRAPGRRLYSIGSRRSRQTPLTPEYARGKETRTVPARARHRTEVAHDKRPQSASIHPTGRVAKAAHTQLSNNTAAKHAWPAHTCIL